MTALTDCLLERPRLQDSVMGSLQLAQRCCQIGSSQVQNDDLSSCRRSSGTCGSTQFKRSLRDIAPSVTSLLPSHPNSSVLFSPRPRHPSTQLCLSSLESFGDLMACKKPTPQHSSDPAESFDVDLNGAQEIPVLLDPTQPATASRMAGSFSAREPDYCQDFQQHVVELLEHWECQFTRALARVDQMADTQIQMESRLDTVEKRLDRLEAIMANTLNPSVRSLPRPLSATASKHHTTQTPSDHLVDLQQSMALSAELIQRQDGIIVELEKRLAAQNRTMEAERANSNLWQHHLISRWRESFHAMEGLKSELQRTKQCLAERDAALTKIHHLVNHIHKVTPNHHSSPSSTALASSIDKFSSLLSPKSPRSRQNSVTDAAGRSQPSATQSSQRHRQSVGSPVS
ncbi:hypothetical protein H4R35_004085 [Dimargaris xerosporica]|nr:hypothetical protein H4R35_004085 [Dimargaris xerosporica]